MDLERKLLRRQLTTAALAGIAQSYFDPSILNQADKLKTPVYDILAVAAVSLADAAIRILDANNEVKP